MSGGDLQDIPLLPALLLVVPLVFALLQLLPMRKRDLATVNSLGALITFGVAVALAVGRPSGGFPFGGPLFLVDDFSLWVLLINTFTGATTSLFSIAYVRHETVSGHGLRMPALRLYHASFQGLMFAMNLVLLSDNIGLMWVGIEIATLATVTMVGLYRTPSALEAAWKYLILGGVGVSLASFGTILLYLGVQNAVGEGMHALAWTVLRDNAAALDSGLLTLAFIFLLLGYGTKAGLVPLHAWLPDAHAEGPTPVTAVLSGLLLNVAIYVILRFRMIISANGKALDPGPVMVAMGLLTLVFAAFMLYGRKDVKRFFAYSSIEHVGLMTLAFGVGGPLANFAGLLHLAFHSLTKSAIFFAVGHAAQMQGGQKLTDLRGLTGVSPRLGWGLVLGMLAISGLPPFGLFMTEFQILAATFARSPWLAGALVLALLVAAGALLLRLGDMAFGEPAGPAAPMRPSVLPLYLHLLLVLVAGLWLPPALAEWLHRLALALG